MTPAIGTELTKLLHAATVRATTALIVLGIPLICFSMLLAAGTGHPQLAAKLGPLADPGGWTGYLATAAQVTAAGGLLGYGVVLSWIIGREFGDGTISGLFALPVRRRTISLAKLLVFLAWGTMTSAALLAVLVVTGLLGGLGPVTTTDLAAAGRQYVLGALLGLIATPAALAATLARSVLAGIGTTVAVLVTAQIAVVLGAGTWYPFSAPALWAITGGTSATIALVVPVAAAAVALTNASWNRLELDR